MNKAELFAYLRTAVLEVREGLSAEAVRADASLFNDLGLDSLSFENLMTMIKCDVADADFTPWYVHASTYGHDTLESLVDFVCGLLPGKGHDSEDGQ